jgi:adenine-specific DNA-methyltransferase
MRYIGSKKNLLGYLKKNIIHQVGPVKGKKFCDLFSGTVSVSKLFKQLNAKIISNDYMSFSYVLQIANLKFNSVPGFIELKKDGLNGYINILIYLNNLKGKEGFFFKNYTIEGTKGKKYQRNYFSGQNGKKLDHILLKLRNWNKQGFLSFEEDSFIRASLIDAVTKVSNISGTYGAFLKKDDKRKYKTLKLRPLSIPRGAMVSNECYNEDAFKLIHKVEGDILYLDPPYNGRQYPPYYHILETVALDDNPNIYGKTGRRPYEDMKSPLCYKGKAADAMDLLINKAQFKHIFLSYNTDGIIPIKTLSEILSKYGNVKIIGKGYRRFKSNSNGNAKDNLREVLLYVEK